MEDDGPARSTTSTRSRAATSSASGSYVAYDQVLSGDPTATVRAADGDAEAAVQEASSRPTRDGRSPSSPGRPAPADRRRRNHGGWTVAGPAARPDTASASGSPASTGRVASGGRPDGAGRRLHRDQRPAGRATASGVIAAVDTTWDHRPRRAGARTVRSACPSGTVPTRAVRADRARARARPRRSAAAIDRPHARRRPDPARRHGVGRDPAMPRLRPGRSGPGAEHVPAVDLRGRLERRRVISRSRTWSGVGRPTPPSRSLASWQSVALLILADRREPPSNRRAGDPISFAPRHPQPA